MLQNIGLILAGLAILIVGAQLLVKGASRLALALGIAPLIVGLTIVAFGTSAPELAVSIQSSLAEKTDLLLGNAVGSNIYNVLFILGVCATITPLAVAPQLIRLDVPIMIGAALTLLLMAQDRVLNRLDGAILIGALVAYMLFVIVQTRKEKTRVKDDYAEQIDESIRPDHRFWLHGLFILAGLALLGLGSDLLIGGAVAIAQALGVAEVIIGMTVVTIGTTAPELSACLMAAWKGERDIAVGNIVGSNLFNILAVLGVGALVAPQGIEVGPRMLSFGIPVMNIVLFAWPARLLRGPGDPPLGRRDVPVFLRDLSRQPGAGGDPGRACTDTSERGCLVHRAASDRDGRGLSLARIPKAHGDAPGGIREIVEAPPG